MKNFLSVLALGFSLSALAANKNINLNVSAPKAVVLVSAQKVNKMPLEDQLAQLIKQELAVKTNELSASFEVSLKVSHMHPKIEAPTWDKIELAGFGGEGSRRLAGLVSFQLLVYHGKNFVTHTVTGLLDVKGPTFVASKNLLRDQIITAGDVEKISTSWAQLQPQAAGIRWNDLVGLRLKSSLDKGSPFHSALLELPPDVKNGDMVELTLLSGPGVQIKSRAVAKGAGRVGDRISIEQPDTKKKLSGIIVGPKSVEVAL